MDYQSNMEAVDVVTLYKYITVYPKQANPRVGVGISQQGSHH